MTHAELIEKLCALAKVDERDLGHSIGRVIIEREAADAIAALTRDLEATNNALHTTLAYARTEATMCESLRNERPKDSYHWSFWDRGRKSAQAIADAIEAEVAMLQQSLSSAVSEAEKP